MDSVYKNSEGYPDPTAGDALTRVIKEKRRYRPLVYICSKFSDDPVGNTEKAKSYSRFAVDRGAIPFTPHLLYPLFMDEETERELALFMGMVMMRKCDELWVFGKEWSDGMRAEINKARRKNMTIRYFSIECKEEAR